MAWTQYLLIRYMLDHMQHEPYQPGQMEKLFKELT